MIKKVVSAGILGFMLAAFPVTSSLSLAEELAARPLLKQGMNGDDILRLQTELKNHGFYQGDIDGIFAEQTKIAVIYFQTDAGILADGVVGEQTWLAIKNYTPTATSRAMHGSRTGQMIAAMAMRHLGTGYAWGGISAGGFDCSGFVYYIFKEHGVTLPRMADGQFDVGQTVPLSALSAGDLVFFTTYEPGPSHVGIYLGNGSFIHASSAAGQVTITPMSKQYYRERYLGARRHFQ